jgi:hypothetical protein
MSQKSREKKTQRMMQHVPRKVSKERYNSSTRYLVAEEPQLRSVNKLFEALTTVPLGHLL